MIPAVRIRLTVGYDGTDFSGFAVNPGVRTVGGTLQDALSTVLDERVEVTCAGRTDRGVHAWGQVVTFDTRSPRLDPGRLLRSLRSMCGPEIVVRDLSIVPGTFDARFSAQWRLYRYSVLNAEQASPDLARYVWTVPGELSLAALVQGATAVVGRHDFSSFCRRPPVPPGGAPVSLDRTVIDAEWQESTTAGGLRRLDFEIRAGAFCHQMVRSIVGLLVDVGRGRRRASQVIDAFGARDRSSVPSPAPPSGLCLWDVGYERSDDLAGSERWL